MHIRGKNPWALIDGKMVASALLLLVLLAGAAARHAQASPCGLTSMTEQSQLVYPPIARAAHVSGNVVLLTRFDNRGVPINIRIVSGPPMLQGAALEFVKSWRANEYTGPRECPIVVTFKMIESDKPACSPQEARPPKFSRLDVQRVSLSMQGLSFCDPGMTVIKAKKRWFR